VNSADLVRAIRDHDWGVVDRAASAPADADDAVAAALAGLDEAARELAVAVVARRDGLRAGELLLKLLADLDLQVVAFAAKSLSEIHHLPDPTALLAAAAKETEPFVRECLYQAVGRTGRKDVLESLRKSTAREIDARARSWAEAALVRLGAPAERETLRKRIPTAPPDDAEFLCDQVVYIGDRSLAKAMLPWAEDEEPVRALDPHGRPVIVRMCDLVVWTAHRLGVSVQPPPRALGRYATETIRSATAGLRA